MAKERNKQVVPKGSSWQVKGNKKATITVPSQKEANRIGKGVIKKQESEIAKVVKKRESAAFSASGNAARLSAVMAPVTKKPESQMTSIEKMEATREGISKKALEELKDKAGFDYDQLSEVLGVARTTLINKKGAEKFPLGLSEKIMSLADLYSFGYEIFGNQEEFNQWIFEPLPALGGQAPYALLDNQYGREEVKSIIGRIAYGVYS
jgi:putative toxin-antitoxin system antitoxin component (TIGR02293 family)